MVAMRNISAHTKRLTERGFSLTEMLVTLFILTLASTLLATGVPVAIDTYQKTVKSSNAQLALSTTISLLRSELGMATDVLIYSPSAGPQMIVYRSQEGYWASIGNPIGGNNRGLVKKNYLGDLTAPRIRKTVTSLAGLNEIDGGTYPLISDSAVTDPLGVRFDKLAWDSAGEELQITNLRVCEIDPDTLAEKNTLASVGDADAEGAGEEGAGEEGAGATDYYPILIRYD